MSLSVPQPSRSARGATAAGGPHESSRRCALHLVVLFAVLAVSEAPRLGGRLGQIAAPIFPPGIGYADFDRAYYPAAQAILHDRSQLYHNAVHDPITGALKITTPLDFVNMPLVAWLFVPFTLLPRPQAGNLLLVCNIGLALASLYLLQRRAAGAPAPLRWALTLAFVTSGPLARALNFGQTSPLILLMLLLGEDRLRHGREVSAGMWLGLVSLVKIPPMLLLPYFCLRRRWRVVAAAGSVLVGAYAVSLLCYGWPLHRTYYEIAIRTNAGTAVAAHNNQSVSALLARQFTDAPLLSWEPMVLATGARLVQWLMVLALVAVSAQALVRMRDRVPYARMLLELGIVMCLTLMISPITWVHYEIWLLPVAAIAGGTLMGPRFKHVRRQALAVLVVAMLLINFPVLPLRVITALDGRAWFRLLISHQLFGTLLLFGLCVWCVRQLYGARVEVESA